MYRMATTRFTDDTWRENCEFRRIHAPAASVCIYASPAALYLVPRRARVFVVEMNNSQDRIEGIGLIHNYPIAQKYRVYSNEDYNRYTFLGKHRLDRTDIQNRQLLEKLEQFCFKGKGHHKRRRGITCVPPQTWKDWCTENWTLNNKEEDDDILLVPSIVDMILLEFCRQFQWSPFPSHWYGPSP
jgi:hypothetical protein